MRIASRWHRLLARATWRAYLSTNGRGGANAVNARDRIGNGPWQNAKGVVIATSVADLHSDNNRSKRPMLSTKREPAVASERRKLRTSVHMRAATASIV